MAIPTGQTTLRLNAEFARLVALLAKCQGVTAAELADAVLMPVVQDQLLAALRGIASKVESTRKGG